MNSTKAKAGESGSTVTGSIANYARLAEFRKALGANLRSGLDYLTPAETELGSSYAIAELVAIIDNLSDQAHVADVAESDETDFQAGPDTNDIPDMDSTATAWREQFIEERKARLAAEDREAELRDRVAELSQDVTQGQFRDKHRATGDTEAASGMRSAKAVEARLETRLRITQSESHDIDFVVDRDEVSIGRKADNAVHIRSPSISRRHARIVRSNGRARIIDCESKNGVYVNSVRVTEQELHDGDQIILGTVELTFKQRVIS